MSSGFKLGRRFTCEPRCDGAVVFNVQRRLGRGVDVLPLGHIVPAHELIARRRGRRHLIGNHGALRVAVVLGDGFPVHRIGAVLGGPEGHGGGHIGHQRHVGHGDLGGGAGAAGLDIDLDGAFRRKLFGEFAACGDRRSVHLNGTAVLFKGIVEGQCRRRGLVVGDGQRGAIMCVAAGSARAGSRAGYLSAAGVPRVVRVAGEAQADVSVGKAGHGAVGGCPRRSVKLRENRQHYANRKRYCK